MQASAPPVELALSRAGVTGVQKAIRIRRGDAETVMARRRSSAPSTSTAAQKGVHMSRFPELFDEAIGEVVLGEALQVEEIAEVIARHIVERQRALRAEVRITARWPMRRIDAGHRPADAGDGLADRRSPPRRQHGARRVVGVEATGINACPCAQGLVARSGRRAARRGGLRRATRSSASSSSSRSRPTTSAAAARSRRHEPRPRRRGRSSISSSAR